MSEIRRGTTQLGFGSVIGRRDKRGRIAEGEKGAKSSRAGRTNEHIERLNSAFSVPDIRHAQHGVFTSCAL